MKRLLIFTAVRAEAKAVADAFGARLPRATSPLTLRAGELEVELHVVGIGAARLPSGLARETVSGIIMAGLAGALDPKLQIGDTIVEGLPEGCEMRFPIHRGRIHTTDALIGTAKEKASLFRKTGALAVEMEGEKARQLARELGVPFLAVRAISDRADEAIDPSILGLVDDVGRARPIAIAGLLLRRPQMAMDLKRLGDNAKLAARNVAAVLKELLTANPDALSRWLNSPR